MQTAQLTLLYRDGKELVVLPEVAERHGFKPGDTVDEDEFWNLFSDNMNAVQDKLSGVIEKLK